ncbi:Lactase-phlorizin hydrolase, partial [Harpegnathos saltator]
KGLNIWDRWTHEHPEDVNDHSNGDIACDSYHKYKEDLEILNNTGVDFYRFSLSWSRILPNGYSNVINYKGLQFYKDLIDELTASGIIPVVTLYHFDLPDVFEQMGGWMNELIVEWMSNFARVVFKELGPKVKYFITINEPLVFCDKGYQTGEMAPGKKLGAIGKYLCLHNVLKAHAKIYHIYDQEFRKQQEGKIGIVVPCSGLFAKIPNDDAATDTYFQFECGIITGPIFSETGDYPKVVKDHIAENSRLQGFSKSILPELSPIWVQFIKNSSDFFGLNHYTSRLVETVPRVANQSWYDYSGVKASIDPSWPSTASAWLKVVPIGFRQIIKKISTEYNYPPIYIMENGMSNANADTNDKNRISYLYSYMKEMLIAMHDDGCNVKAYAVWSLLDNFEWSSGYTEKFGMVRVDFEDPNRARTPKSSLQWYKNVIRTRRLYNEIFVDNHTVLKM